MFSRMLQLLIISFFALFDSSCKKENSVSIDTPTCLYCDDPKEKFQLEVVWSTPINVNYNSNLSNLTPVIYNNKVLMGALKLENEVIYCLDKLTGNKIWEWSGYKGSSNYTESINVYNNVGLISHTFRDYAIDLNAGQSIWTYESASDYTSGPRGSLTGGYLYHPWDPKGVGAGVDSIAWMMRTRPDFPQWDTVYTERMDSTRCNVNFEPPSLWIDPLGDSNLVFQRRSFNYQTLKDRNDFIVYNTNKKQVIYRINNIGYPYTSSVNPILISGNKAILFGWTTVYCVNLVSGNILWQYAPHRSDLNNNGNVSAFIDRSHLFVKTSADIIYCLDLNTGKPKWTRNDVTELGVGSRNMVIFENKLYFIAHEYLVCLDALNGKTVFRYKSPNIDRTDKKGYFSTLDLVGLDAGTGHLYFTDSYYFNCVKLK